MKYKNIIFDLGAVLFDLNYQLTREAFVNLGLDNYDSIFSKYKQENYFDEFERGEISDVEFRNKVKEHLSDDVTDEMIDKAWNAMLIGVPLNRYEWLTQVSKKHNIFLLSNTNRIHITEVKNAIHSDYGWGKFESLFKNVYYSCELGMRKPETRIFDFVINDNNLDRAKTVFIDDSPQHIEGAIKSGIQAFHLPDDMRVEQLYLDKILGG